MPASSGIPARPHPCHECIPHHALQTRLPSPQAKARRRLGRLGKGDAAAAIAAYLDAQLAGIDERDSRFSLLRGCTATLLQLGSGGPDAAGADAAGGAAEAAADAAEGSGGAAAAGARRLFPSVAALVQQGSASLQRLQQLQAACAGAQVRIMGGGVAGSVGQQVTHVVGLLLAPPTPPAADGAEAGLEAEAEAEAGTAPAGGVQPQALLAVVSQQAGGGTAVASLRLGISTGAMHLVTHRWVLGLGTPALLASQHTPALVASHGAPVFLPVTKRSLHIHLCPDCSWVDACMSESRSYGAGSQPLSAQGELARVL